MDLNDRVVPKFAVVGTLSKLEMFCRYTFHFAVVDAFIINVLSVHFQDCRDHRQRLKVSSKIMSLAFSVTAGA